jgi:hypothetical protein
MHDLGEPTRRDALIPMSAADSPKAP